MKGFVIAAPQSGAGKTTISLAVMAALRARGLNVQPFKVGPDFIDPGHHSIVTGNHSCNLDGWMLSRQTNQRLFAEYSQGADIAVVEGVMGLFDGSDGKSEDGSTAQMAKWLKLPVVLVVDARSMARSVAALVHGFKTFDPELKIPFVILNKVGSKRHLDYLKDALSEIKDLKVLGGIPREEEITIPSRHLGLVTSQEFLFDKERIRSLAAFIEKHLTLDLLLESLEPIDTSEAVHMKAGKNRVRIGVARDKAFCFYYEENLRLLAAHGAELVEFSPLSSKRLPKDLDAIYIGGGYPEVFASTLAANNSLLKDIRAEAASGTPIYGECGGLMYLSKAIMDANGQRHEMCGLLPFEVRMLNRLKSLGYREARLVRDTFLGPAETRIRGHEFHYSEIVDPPLQGTRTLYDLTGRKGMISGDTGYVRGNVIASYIHLHFGSNPDVPLNFVTYLVRRKYEGANMAAQGD